MKQLGKQVFESHIAQENKKELLQADNPFVRCPDAFLAGLSPEQYRERLQLYESAYEKAQKQIARPKPFVPPFEFDMEQGSGI